MEIFTESQFSACYIHYRRRVRGYILSRVSDREEAEDLTQDVFENIWRCREGVRKETLHNLVYTVMRNTVIDYLRRRYMKKDKMDIYTCCEEEGRNTVEEDYYYKELRVAHRKMVKQLSEKRRQAYILYFYRVGMDTVPLSLIVIIPLFISRPPYFYSGQFLLFLCAASACPCPWISCHR